MNDLEELTPVGVECLDSEIEVGVSTSSDGR